MGVSWQLLSPTKFPHKHTPPEPGRTPPQSPTTSGPTPNPPLPPSNSRGSEAAPLPPCEGQSAVTVQQKCSGACCTDGVHFRAEGVVHATDQNPQLFASAVPSDNLLYSSRRYSMEGGQPPHHPNPPCRPSPPRASLHEAASQVQPPRPFSPFKGPARGSALSHSVHLLRGIPPLFGDPRECRGDVAFPPTCGPHLF